VLDNNNNPTITHFLWCFSVPQKKVIQVWKSMRASKSVKLIMVSYVNIELKCSLHSLAFHLIM